MKELKFRTLFADEIDCRVGTDNGSGVSLLLYKDARVDMRLLDEVVGAFNWKREHTLINNNLFCTVSIYNEETKEWISKQDVGTESNTEKEKGQASDAFKRACFNWGIGRELYTSPFIWINLNNDEWRLDRMGKKRPDVSFKVKEIEYQDGKITKLVIVDRKGDIRFSTERGVTGKKVSSKVSKPMAQQNMPIEDRLMAALNDVEACNSVDELTALYHAYKADFGKEQRFIDALAARKGTLLNK